MKKKILRIWLVLFIFVIIEGRIMGVINSRNVAKAENKSAEYQLDDKFLKTDGKVLRNKAGKGEIVTLRGTNIGGWQVMEAWMCPTNAPDQVTAIKVLTERFGKEKAEYLFKLYEKSWWQEEDFDYIKELNFNVIRLPISYLNLLDEDNKVREDTLATYDWFVEECKKRDIYVILDLHAAPASQNGRDHSGDTSGSRLYKDEEAQNLTLYIWEELAKRFKGNSTIAGYDLLNEPEGDEEERAPWGALQLPFYDRLYQAIREIDPDHIIIFNAIWEPVNMPNPAVYGWENVVYEYHFYGWDGIDNPTKQRNFTDSKVTNNSRAGHEVPVFVGEFTLFEKLQSWEHALKVYEENGWSWTTWTYKTVDQGSWGIFNSKKSITPDVNIYQDSFEMIEKKWSQLDTATKFTKNKYIYDLLKVMADTDAARNNPRVWFQNVTSEVSLRAGTDAKAEIVDDSETYTTRGNQGVIRLTVTTPEQRPTETTRNVCFPPTIRNSVDATGMDYLIFHTYSKHGNRSLNVTLVDKNGDTWSSYTSSSAMPIAFQWEKLFVDVRDATIDKSAIIEIRIGVNEPGTYYFDHIYFSSSYSDPFPSETEEMMRASMGEVGTVTDWSVFTAGNQVKRKIPLWVTFVTIGIVVSVMLLYLKKNISQEGH